MKVTKKTERIEIKDRKIAFIYSHNMASFNTIYNGLLTMYKLYDHSECFIVNVYKNNCLITSFYGVTKVEIESTENDKIIDIFEV